MATLDISQATATDMTNAFDVTAIETKDTDGISDLKETEYINSNWSTYYGYFLGHPELKAAVLMKGIWDVGKGWTADPDTQSILEHISGCGKDTFDDILFNMDVCRYVGRDSFAEIVKDKESGILMNLKPLDPSSIRIVVDGKGIIKRYEQIKKNGDKNVVVHAFNPEDIFHLSNDRIADNIHGTSVIESLDNTMLAEIESFTDVKKLMHQQAKPFIIFKWKTDDPVKIQEMKERIDKLRNLGEDLHIPDDDNVLTHEVVQVNPSDIVLAWRQDITNKFYRALGLPIIIFGSSSGTTESGGKIQYLAHEQVFEREQRYLEKQIWNQLFLKINLIPPTTLLENLQQDEAKDRSATGAPQGLEMQQGDVTPGKGE